jgi:heme A synthase
MTDSPTCAVQEQLGFWKQTLQGAPALLELPTDRLRREAMSFAGAELRFDMPAATRDGLQQLAAAEKTTMFVVVLAALQVLLAKYSGQQDIVVGTPYANRDMAEIQELIGPFVK